MAEKSSTGGVAAAVDARMTELLEASEEDTAVVGHSTSAVGCAATEWLARHTSDVDRVLEEMPQMLGSSIVEYCTRSEDTGASSVQPP